MVSSRPAIDEQNEALSALLARVALGDRSAFAALYKATSAQLFGVILRVQRDRAQAEDVLQEIFVSIWRAAQGFDASRAPPMAWLISIARHRAIDSLRRRKSDVATVSAYVAGDDGGPDTDLVEGLPSQDAGPLDLLLQAAQMRDVSRCVGALSAEQQQCVALAFYQGLTHSEVASHMCKPLGTVKSWVRRALMALKDCLDRPPLADTGR